eukprot:scaffold5490_cov125-Cylindrotheca_fusiformis.AAC.5
MDPAKHSEEFFQDRIDLLKNQIKDEIPASDSPLPHAFVDACKALKSSNDTKKKAQDLLDKLKKEKADNDAIKKAQSLVDSCEQTIEAMWKCELEAGSQLLDSLDLGSLEEALVECSILVQATPKGLAAFCAKDASHGPLVDEFLSNADWMKLMILHGGASKGNYGQAIKIHSNLLAQIKDNSTEVRRRLALAVSLELASNIKVFHKDTFVDPVERFWHFVNAYEKNELDEKFEKFTVWELRKVVDCDATDDDLQWGREYLKAYRPDEMLSTDDRWKYVLAVRSDINYHHPEHDFSNYRELLSAGGVCGARAWFGRFIAKCHGMPTWGVRQPGHAAMSRWTPQGWVTCLGAGFQYSSWDDNRANGKSRSGLDFEEETKARRNTTPSEYYQKMDLLECLAESLGERVQQEVNPDKIWRSLSLVQRRILAEQEQHDRENGECIDLESKVQPVPGKIPNNCHGGCFIIPASTFTNSPSASLLTMPSFLGGDQLHISHSKSYMEEETGFLDYEIPEILPAGSYHLSCRVVTVHRFQAPLHLTIDNFDEDDDDTVDIQSIEVPYTVGKWQTTKSLQVQLKPGAKLRFSRESPYHGLTIKEFLLEQIHGA